MVSVKKSNFAHLKVPCQLAVLSTSPSPITSTVIGCPQFAELAMLGISRFRSTPVSDSTSYISYISSTPVCTKILQKIGRDNKIKPTTKKRLSCESIPIKRKNIPINNTHL